MVLVLLVFGLVVFIVYWLYVGCVFGLLFLCMLFGILSFFIGVFGNLFVCIGSGGMLFFILLFL